MPCVLVVAGVRVMAGAGTLAAAWVVAGMRAVGGIPAGARLLVLASAPMVADVVLVRVGLFNHRSAHRLALAASTTSGSRG